MMRAKCKNCGLNIWESTQGGYTEYKYWVHDTTGSRHCAATVAIPEQGPKEWGIRNHPIVPKEGDPAFCQRCSGRADDAIHHPPSERMLEAERRVS